MESLDSKTPYTTLSSSKMDNSAVVKAINEAALHGASASEPEKAQLVEACYNLLHSVESLESRLMALFFSVRFHVYSGARTDADTYIANQSSSTSSWN